MNSVFMDIFIYHIYNKFAFFVIILDFLYSKPMFLIFCDFKKKMFQKNLRNVCLLVILKFFLSSVSAEFLLKPSYLEAFLNIGYLL